MKKRLYTGILILFALVTSCHQRVSSDIFSKIEDYMEAHPDSALLLLHQIPHPERLAGEQRANYALFLTQARDRNFLDSLQSDSLIKIAADYYRDSKDDVKAGKSLFYYGKVMALQDNDTLAMRAYLDAQNRLENTREYKILGLTQEHIGLLKNDQGLQNTALNNYQQSINFYLKAGDTLGAVYGCRNIAWLFEKKQNIDSACIYLNKGITLLKGDTTTSIWPSLLHLEGVLLKKKGSYTDAINYFSTAIKYEKAILSVPFYYFSLGDLYMQTGYLDKAEECFKQGISSERNYTKGTANKYLYSLEKHRGNHVKALSYKEKADTLFDIYRDEKSASNILVIQQKYEKRELFIENKLIKEKKQIQMYLGIAIFILLVVFCFIFYSWIKKQYRNNYKKHLKEYAAKTSEEIETNKRIIEQCSCQIEELQLQDIQMKEEAKSQIGKLKQQIVILKNKNKETDNTQDGIYILKELMTSKLIIPSMNKTEKMLLFECIDLTQEKFATRLREEYDLNEKELLLAIFVRLSFSTELLAYIFDCDQNSIYKKKTRLKSSLHLGKEDDLDKFLKKNPSKLYR